MKINIICIGKLKEKYLVDAEKEYVKRLSRFCELKIIELNEERENTPNALLKEAERILSKINDKDFVIALAIEGRKRDSEDFSKDIISIFESGKQSISFVIGGSEGLDESVKKRADYLLSFSDMTFPHQLMRIILLEQLFRAYKIANKEKYHK